MFWNCLMTNWYLKTWAKQWTLEVVQSMSFMGLWKVEQSLQNSTLTKSWNQCSVCSKVCLFGAMSTWRKAFLESFLSVDNSIYTSQSFSATRLVWKCAYYVISHLSFFFAYLTENSKRFVFEKWGFICLWHKNAIEIFTVLC